MAKKLKLAQSSALGKMDTAPRIRPKASPVDMSRGYQAGRAPARPSRVTGGFVDDSDPIISPAMQGNSALDHLARFVTGIQPGLAAAGDRIDHENRKEAQAQAADAVKRQRGNTLKLEEYYKSHPEARAWHPEFEVAYQKERLHLVATTAGASLLEEIAKNPDGVLNPAQSAQALQKFIDTKRQELYKANEGVSPEVSAALHNTFDAYASKAMQYGIRERVHRMEVERRDNFKGLAGKAIDTALGDLTYLDPKTKGAALQGLAAALSGIMTNSDPKSNNGMGGGMAHATVNKLIAEAVLAKANATGDAELLKVLNMIPAGNQMLSKRPAVASAIREMSDKLVRRAWENEKHDRAREIIRKTERVDMLTQEIAPILQKDPRALTPRQDAAALKLGGMYLVQYTQYKNLLKAQYHPDAKTDDREYLQLLKRIGLGDFKGVYAKLEEMRAAGSITHSDMTTVTGRLSKEKAYHKELYEIGFVRTQENRLVQALALQFKAPAGSEGKTATINLGGIKYEVTAFGYNIIEEARLDFRRQMRAYHKGLKDENKELEYGPGETAAADIVTKLTAAPHNQPAEPPKTSTQREKDKADAPKQSTLPVELLPALDLKALMIEPQERKDSGWAKAGDAYNWLMTSSPTKGDQQGLGESDAEHLVRTQMGVDSTQARIIIHNLVATLAANDITFPSYDTAEIVAYYLSEWNSAPDYRDQSD